MSIFIFHSRMLQNYFVSFFFIIKHTNIILMYAFLYGTQIVIFYLFREILCLSFLHQSCIFLWVQVWGNTRYILTATHTSHEIFIYSSNEIVIDSRCYFCYFRHLSPRGREKSWTSHPATFRTRLLRWK